MKNHIMSDDLWYFTMMLFAGMVMMLLGVMTLAVWPVVKIRENIHAASE